jgi:hypothetical protein
MFAVARGAGVAVAVTPSAGSTARARGRGPQTARGRRPQPISTSAARVSSDSRAGLFTRGAPARRSGAPSRRRVNAISEPAASADSDTTDANTAAGLTPVYFPSSTEPALRCTSDEMIAAAMLDGMPTSNPRGTTAELSIDTPTDSSTSYYLQDTTNVPQQHEKPPWYSPDKREKVLMKGTAAGRWMRS